MTEPYVLVRVSDEILGELRANGATHPVVVMGVEQCGDGTHDMILKTPLGVRDADGRIHRPSDLTFVYEEPADA